MNMNSNFNWLINIESTLDSAHIEDVLDFVSQHSLTGQFLRYVKFNSDLRQNKDLLLRAWSAHTRAKQHVNEQIKAMRELSASPILNGQRILVLKGFSAYALTEEEHHLRYSGDLDVLGPDSNLLCEALSSLCYQELGAVYGHEQAQMQRSGVMVEVHNYVPVWSYPPNANNIDLNPTHFPGIWRQSIENLRIQSINYNHLLNSAVCSTKPQTNGIWIVDLHYQIIIACAHQFRNFVGLGQAQLPIKLGELSAIRDLMLHPIFNVEHFSDLVELHEAEDSVSFAISLLSKLLQFQPPEILSRFEAPDSDSLPRILAHLGCWASLDNDVHRLISPIDTDQVVRCLGASVLSVSEVGESAFQWASFGHDSMLPKSNYSRLNRIIFQTRRDELFPFGIRCVSTPAGLCLDIALLNSLDQDEDYHVAVHGSSWTRSHAVNIRGFEAKIEQGGHGKAYFLPLQADLPRRTLRILMPWMKTPTSFQQPPTSILLEVAKWHRQKSLTSPEDEVINADPIVVVPLQIVYA